MSLSYSNGAATAAHIILEEIQKAKDRFIEYESHWIICDALDLIKEKAEEIKSQGESGYF